MSPKHKKHRRGTVLLYSVLFVLLCGCGGNNQVPTVLSAPFRPFLALQVCLDDTASYPPEYTQAAQKAIAERIDALTQPNTGGMDVFVTVIAASSFQNGFAFHVPAISALPVKLVPGSDPYGYAKAMSAYKKALPAALNQLHAIQAQVKVHTDMLRNLRLSVRAGGTDIPGCLDDAAQHFSHVAGNKVLLIVSDLQSNVNTQFTNNLSIYGAMVRVYWRVCEVESACQQNDNYWRKLLLHFGASSVGFYDPAESQAENINF